MAGEWIAVDLCLDEKPEVQELIDLTGQPVELVCFRLWKLWGWASVNCDTGEARMTLPRLARVCGGGVDFWQAVASVGWLEIDETAGTVAIPGWDRRFSQSAKSRIQHQDRAKAQDERDPDRKKRFRESSCAQAQDSPAPPRSRGDRGDRGEVPPPPREAAHWETLRTAWNAGKGRPWKPHEPPEGIPERLAEPGWYEQAIEAIQRIPRCRYFRNPPTLIQFAKPGFVAKINGGAYDDVTPKHRDGDERPTPRVDPEWEKRKAATLAKLKAEGRA